MVATFNVILDTGGTDNSPGTSTNTDALGPPNIRFKRADDPTIDSVAPNLAVTTSFSRWKQIFLKCTGAPSTQVDNVKLYSDGSNFGAGITLNVADANPVHTSVATTGYDVSDTNDQDMSSGGHTDVTTVTDMFTFTSGAPRTCTIGEAGAIINATNETTNYVVLQLKTTASASPGNLADETLTWQYDEI